MWQTVFGFSFFPFVVSENKQCLLYKIGAYQRKLSLCTKNINIKLHNWNSSGNCLNFPTNFSPPFSSTFTFFFFSFSFFFFFFFSFFSYAGTPAPCGSGRVSPSPLVSAVSLAFFFILIHFFLRLFFSLFISYHQFHLSLHLSQLCVCGLLLIS